MNPFVNAKIYQTCGIAKAAEESDAFKAQIIIALGRFFNMDWGELCKEDVQANKQALQAKDRILAVYATAKDKIWIIAESYSGDKYDVLTILFPSEY